VSLALAKVNTHIHLPPNFSAFNTVDEAIDQAGREGIEILGASNYYDFTVYEAFSHKAAQHGIQPLFGIEIVCRLQDLVDAGVKINDPGNPGKMYICGKALTRFKEPSKRAAELLDKIRSGDEQRIAKMVKLLKDVFEESAIDIDLDSTAIIAWVAKQFGVPKSTVVLQERHVAQAFQEALFEQVSFHRRSKRMSALFDATSKVDPSDSVGVQSEIRTYLMKAGKPAFVEENFVTFSEACELIKELGGFVSYPVLADGMNPISEFESDPAELATKLSDLGIEAAEFIPNRNKPEVLEAYAKALAAKGFSLSAGTEHNTTERIAVMPECKGGVPIPMDLQEIFVQGARRQVAHQNAVGVAN
jgi:hypothetical protein